MRSLGNITTAWGLVSELDLQPLRNQALRQPVIAVAGKPGTGRHTLASHMRRDPARPEVEAATPIPVLDLEEADQLSEVDLCVLILRTADQDDRAERLLVRKWLDAGMQVLVIFNQPFESSVPEKALSAVDRSAALDTWTEWGKQNVLVGSVDDDWFLQSIFVPAVMRLLPARHLALGRHFPLFRVSVARHLINESCFSNAAYSFSTGIIEIIPIVNIPLNVADVVILTKNQIFLVFKLGLALGMSTRLQSYITAFGGVLGGGLFWRQLAHMVVGLIPAWGILPKVGIAYAGTYVVGTAVLQWYLTGRHISKTQMRQLYDRAYASGKQLVSKMRPRLPRLPFGRRKKSPKRLGAVQSVKTCAVCGNENAVDARYCQNCGNPLDEPQLPAG